MPKAKRAIPKEVLKFTYDPDMALRRCAYTSANYSRLRPLVIGQVMTIR